MKKLISIGLLCFLIIGCSESPVDESGKHVAKRSGANEFNMVMFPGNGEQTFRYVMVDGHEYLVMTGCHRSGLTHSPKCQCLKNKVEIVLPLNVVTNEMTQVVPL